MKDPRDRRPVSSKEDRRRAQKARDLERKNERTGKWMQQGRNPKG